MSCVEKALRTQHCLSALQDMEFVRKEISMDEGQTTSETAQKNEREILFLLGSLRHDNLVKLLASYSHKGVTNLLFEPAAMDLDQFFLSPTRIHGFDEDWMFYKATRGLADGLDYLHNFRPFVVGKDVNVTKHGYHHDIKPRNILVQGTAFILSDFGTSRLKALDSNTKTLWKDTTVEYGAPESRSEADWSPQDIGRAFDIWSLGCILCEVGAFVEDGNEGVASFRSEREISGPYGDHRNFHHDGELNRNVGVWLERKERSPTAQLGSQFFALCRRLLIIEPARRPPSYDVVQALSYLSLQGLFQSIMEKIKNYSAAIPDGTGTHLHRIRVKLEEKRLTAWAWVLGLTSLKGNRRVYDTQLLKVWPQCITLLQTLGSRLTETCNTQEPKLSHLTLDALFHTNNNLSDEVSQESRLLIDDTFNILSTSNQDVSSLQGIEGVALDDTTPGHYREAGMTAAVRLMALLTSQNHSTNVGARIEPALITPDGRSKEPKTFWYADGFQEGDRRRVLVEMKGYGTKWTQDAHNDSFRETGEKIFQRIQALVAMLREPPYPERFRILKCLGSFHNFDKKSFGIVYGLPTRESIPIALHRIIEQRRTREEIPSINERLSLAKTLAISVHAFHLAGWLHKNITSRSILFFLETEAEVNVCFEEPYVTGFHHSRKDGKEEYTSRSIATDTEIAYQHPAYAGGSEPYRKIHDYYSLGLILLEIGIWKTLDPIRLRHPTYSPKQLREEFLKYCRLYIKSSMGDIYHDVVMSCLTLGSDGTESSEIDQDTKEHLEFLSAVIEKLSSCRI